MRATLTVSVVPSGGYSKGGPRPGGDAIELSIKDTNGLLTVPDVCREHIIMWREQIAVRYTNDTLVLSKPSNGARGSMKLFDLLVGIDIKAVRLELARQARKNSETDFADTELTRSIDVPSQTIDRISDMLNGYIDGLDDPGLLLVSVLSDSTRYVPEGVFTPMGRIPEDAIIITPKG